MPSASTVITMSAGISPSDATATEWRPSRSSSMTPVCTGSGLWGIDHSRADLVGKRDRDRPPGRLSGWGAPGLEPQPFLEHVDARRRRPHARQPLEQGDRPRHGCPRLDRERIEIGQAGAGADARSVFLVAAALVGCQQRRGAGIAQEGRPAGVGEGHGPAAGVAEHDLVPHPGASVVPGRRRNRAGGDLDRTGGRRRDGHADDPATGGRS